MSPFGYLKPSESLTEICAGLIMVLTFTLAASVVVGGGADGARAALIGAIGCNTAWGLIDATFYLMSAAIDRNRRSRLARAVTSAPNEAAALVTIRDELDRQLTPVTRPEDREQLYRSIRNAVVHGPHPPKGRVTRDDIVGALAVFSLGPISALPAILPLVLISDPWIALRASNLLVVLLMFIVGYHWAKYIEANRWLAGFVLLAIGLALVAIAIPLEG
jgi:VIT1/CCC1 family predicted Fe2+/Mn2+ transporter